MLLGRFFVSKTSPHEREQLKLRLRELEKEDKIRIVGKILNAEELESRRDEIIKALDATAKPYFGDLASMTYVEWAERFVDLVFPVVDPKVGGQAVLGRQT
mgnify:CR=1 FL=1